MCNVSRTGRGRPLCDQGKRKRKEEKKMKKNSLDYLLYDLDLSVLDAVDVYKKALQHFQDKQFSFTEKNDIYIYFDLYTSKGNENKALYDAICINTGEFNYDALPKKAAMLFTLGLFERAFLYDGR